MFYGILDLPWWGYLVTFLITTQLTIMSVTLYLHRCSAHRSIDMHPILSHFFRFWLWITTGMGTKAWTAIHRKHHAKCETKDDPHSPIVLGIKTVMWKGAELYRREQINQETLDRYGHGTPNDWLENNLYSKSTYGLYSLLVLAVVLFGVPGIGFWALQMAWIPFFAAGVVNGLGHYWGYRNFECADASTNLSPIGFFIGGEELHNNHHTYPTSAKFSIKPWEFDIGWLYLVIFRTLGLVKIKRVAPKVKSVPGKTLDLETVRHLINNRFQVMTRYTKDVTLPVLKAEKRVLAPADWKIVKSVKSALTREPSRVDVSAKERLALALPKSKLINQTYEFRVRLQNIWNQSTASPKELMEALQQWCKEAEATGLKALRDFSQYIQTYHLQANYL